MDFDATQKYVKNEFDKVCDGCGCRFHVEASMVEGAPDTEEYNCPKCGKAFSTQAALPPEVTPLENCG